MTNEQKQFDLLDFITIVSLVLQLQNLDENREQTKEIHTILMEINEHLHKQDELIERNGKQWNIKN